ncbi:hypothetical protein YC2023_093752 [Brassica napus]
MEKESMKNMMKWRPAWPKTIVKGDHIFELMKQLRLPNQLNFKSRANHCVLDNCDGDWMQNNSTDKLAFGSSIPLD